MLFARVIGNVVCTRKDDKLVGTKLLMVQPVDLQGASKGNPIVAIDVVGAGEGELVLIVQGSSARQTKRTEGNPVDCTIFAIVDSVERDGKIVFRKTQDYAEGRSHNKADK
ncbi:MAG: EutN/CcmL family microcompartment protein [Elusimicrobia bacterium]|nr:EutN/CcmL family microcompartment protein [Elusimicrobiota bacterium]